LIGGFMTHAVLSLLRESRHPMRINLVGVAGSGMSGLASLLLSLGHRVSGSDKVSTVETDRLQKLGLRFFSPHCEEEVADCDMVIYSSAIKPGNTAYAAAYRLGIPLVRRAESLAALMANKKGVVVGGTHGKTTTSALTDSRAGFQRALGSRGGAVCRRGRRERRHAGQLSSGACHHSQHRA
jgi:UDP-N-acetylmuramate-alanine ligase